MSIKGSSSAPAPDPQIGEAALLQAKTGQDWLNFAKDAFEVSTGRQAELDALTKEVTNLQIGLAKDQTDWSREDRQRYEEKFRPIEDSFVEEATNYATPERQAAAAAEAKADVQTSAAAARAAAGREAAAVGINPASGRYAGIDRAGEMGTALATAGAQNNARQMVRDKGLALKADAVNLGRGLPAQSAQAAAMGLNAGSSAVGLNQGTNAQYLASTDIMGSGYRGQMAGYAGQASTLNQQYSNQISAWQAQQQANAASASGIGSFLGGAMGLIFSDETMKTDKTEIPEGTALEMVKQMPVEEWTYKPGVEDEGRHVGTYAQDFQEATGKGDGRTIPVQDALGITMKAVQDLAVQVEQLAAGLGMGATPAAGAKKPAEKKPANENRPMQKAAGLGV